ncbi:MAG: vWA domain-containing protein [Acidiferrobacterales bacterium]
MQEFRFKADGLTQKDYRRWKRLVEPSAIAPRFFTVVAVVIFGLYLIKPIVDTLLFGFIENKPVASVPLSGAFPKTFTKTAGSFELSVTPLDPDGEMISKSLNLHNFSFTSITVSDRTEPGKIISTGRAYATGIEIIYQQESDRGMYVVMLFDSSDSMNKNDPKRLRITAGKKFIDHLGSNFQVAVMDFKTLHADFTSENTELNRAIEGVKASGGTPLFRKIKEAIEHLDKQNAINRAVFVFTDGRDKSGGLPSVIEKAKASNTPIFSIGLGEKINFSDLERLAKETSGSFAQVDRAEELTSFFEALAISASRGRVVVTARGLLDAPLAEKRNYVLSGYLITTVGGKSTPTPFRFVMKIVE